MDTAVVQIKRMDRKVWRRAKAAAALTGVTLNEFVERAIRDALDRKELVGGNRPTGTSRLTAVKSKHPITVGR